MKARHRYAQTVEHRATDGVIRPDVVAHDYTHAVPLAGSRREEIYRRQNAYRPLTARQLRQIARASRRSALSRRPLAASRREDEPT